MEEVLLLLIDVDVVAELGRLSAFFMSRTSCS